MCYGADLYWTYCALLHTAWKQLMPGMLNTRDLPFPWLNTDQHHPAWTLASNQSNLNNSQYIRWNLIFTALSMTNFLLNLQQGQEQICKKKKNSSALLPQLRVRKVKTAGRWSLIPSTNTPALVCTESFGSYSQAAFQGPTFSKIVQLQIFCYSPPFTPTVSESNRSRSCLQYF